MEKSIHELKAEFVYLILWEKKINSLEITVIIFKVFKKCKSLMPLIHGQIYLIKLIWHIFWIKNGSIKFHVYTIKLVWSKLIKWFQRDGPFRLVGVIQLSSTLLLSENVFEFVRVECSNVRRLYLSIHFFFWRKI